MKTHSYNADRPALEQLRSALREVDAGKRPPLDDQELAVFAKAIRPDAETTIELTRSGDEPMVIIRAVKRVRTPIPQQSALNKLSPREFEVARLIASAMTNREIADKLGIAIGTVKDHVHQILAALGVKSRQGIVAIVVGEMNRTSPD